MSTVALARRARRLAAETLRGDARRPLIVGEMNPYGGADCFALFPLPASRSGGKLAAHLGLDAASYIERFDRANLCRGEWSAEAAQRRASCLLAERRPALILLGKKVCAAFGVEYAPFTADERPDGVLFCVLPHPSGRNLAWNDDVAPQMARDALRVVGAL